MTCLQFTYRWICNCTWSKCWWSRRIQKGGEQSLRILWACTTWCIDNLMKGSGLKVLLGAAYSWLAGILSGKDLSRASVAHVHWLPILIVDGRWRWRSIQPCRGRRVDGQLHDQCCTRWKEGHTHPQWRHRCLRHSHFLGMETEYQKRLWCRWRSGMELCCTSITLWLLSWIEVSSFLGCTPSQVVI